MAKLSDKKHRDREGLFRLDGVKLFFEAVSSGIRTEYIFIAESKREKLTKELSAQLQAASGTVIFVSDEVLEKLTDEAGKSRNTNHGKRTDRKSDAGKNISVSGPRQVNESLASSGNIPQSHCRNEQKCFGCSMR